MKTLAFSTLMSMLLPASCFHGEGERQALHQAGEAGSMIAAHPDAPAEVRQAGADVRANVSVVQNSVGLPAAPQPYSPQASAAARDQAVKEQNEAPALLTSLGNIVAPIAPWAPAAIAFGWGVLNNLKRKGAEQRLIATYQGIEKAKEEVAGGRYADAITSTLRTVAGAYNVYTDIKAELRRLKDAGKVSEARPPAPASTATA